MPAWEAVGLVSEHSGAARVGRRRGAARGPRRTSSACSSRSIARVGREGRAHLVTLIGEAGVGKSRLLREFGAPGARPTRPPPCAPAAACPTGRASSTGRSARCCGPRPASWTPTSPTRRGQSSAATSTSVLRESGSAPETPERRAAQIGRSLGIDVPPELVPADAGIPSGCARRSSPRCAAVIEAAARTAAAGAGLRGHPLGRRRHARRDRAPGAVGAGAAAAWSASPATSCSSAAPAGAAGGATRPSSSSSR